MKSSGLQMPQLPAQEHQAQWRRDRVQCVYALGGHAVLRTATSSVSRGTSQGRRLRSLRDWPQFESKKLAISRMTRKHPLRQRPSGYGNASHAQKYKVAV